MDIVKVGFSGGNLGKNIGCEKAPDAIAKELSTALLNENSSLVNFDVKDFKVDSINLEQNHRLILNQAKALDLTHTIFIGGDHSITYSLAKAFCSKTKNPGMIIFDAHPDLMPGFNPATHDNYLRMLIEDNTLKPENVILMGIRAVDRQEQLFIRNKKITAYSMKQLHADLGLILHVMEQLQKFDAVYLSIDIDVVDPVFAPGTGYCEVGGLSSRELIMLVQKLRLLKNLKWVDIVEVNPQKDINNLTVKLGAKLIQEASV